MFIKVAELKSLLSDVHKVYLIVRDMNMLLEEQYGGDFQKMLGLSYVAGFIDGEGCITIFKQKYKSSDGQTKWGHRLRIAIGQNDFEILKKVKDTTGVHGKIFTKKRTIQTNRTCYVLHFDGKHALQLIRKLMPYLLRKRPEAEAIEAFWEEGKMDMRTGRKPVPEDVWNTRETWYRKLQRMK
jgi:hypothetical protein